MWICGGSPVLQSFALSCNRLPTPLSTAGFAVDFFVVGKRQRCLHLNIEKYMDLRKKEMSLGKREKKAEQF